MSFLTSWPRPLCLHEIYIKTSARKEGEELKKGERRRHRAGGSCHGGIRKRGYPNQKLRISKPAEREREREREREKPWQNVIVITMQFERNVCVVMRILPRSWCSNCMPLRWRAKKKMVKIRVARDYGQKTYTKQNAKMWGKSMRMHFCRALERK